MPVITTGADTGDLTDVVEMILADHREMERLLRLTRDDTQDRGAALQQLSHLLVAHAEAEERHVYPVLERKADDEEVADEVAHGEEEHAEINEKLLAALEAAGAPEMDAIASEAFDEALEELGEMTHHHLSEEERNVLNPARDLVDETKRTELGETFLAARRQMLSRDPGDVAKVRELVETARNAGLL